MDKGSCYTGQTGMGILFGGLAFPHLFFKKTGAREVSVTSWENKEITAFRCPKCKAVLILPD